MFSIPNLLFPRYTQISPLTTPAVAPIGGNTKPTTTHHMYFSLTTGSIPADPFPDFHHGAAERNLDPPSEVMVVSPPHAQHIYLICLLMLTELLDLKWKRLILTFSLRNHNLKDSLDTETSIFPDHRAQQPRGGRRISARDQLGDASVVSRWATLVTRLSSRLYSNSVSSPHEPSGTLSASGAPW